MEQKIIFREMLSEIKALADAKNNRLTTDEVDDFFANAQLDRAQLEMIYEYLVNQKIQVDGYRSGGSGLFSDTAAESAQAETAADPGEEGQPQERLASLELYLNEIGQMQRPEAAEELRLFRLALQGDAEAKSRLVELYLPMVCELAGDYDGEALPVEDLIQEGNIGLLLTMEQLEERDSLAAYQVQVMNAVNQHMQDILQQHKDMRELGDGIAQRVTHLSQAIRNLEEDLEHRVSVEELSAYLEMPAEEIKDILKMAGDELEVDGT